MLPRRPCSWTPCPSHELLVQYHAGAIPEQSSGIDANAVPWRTMVMLQQSRQRANPERPKGQFIAAKPPIGHCRATVRL